MELWKTVEPVRRIWSFERHVETDKRKWRFGGQLNLLNEYRALKDMLNLLSGNGALGDS